MKQRGREKSSRENESVPNGSGEPGSAGRRASPSVAPRSRGLGVSQRTLVWKSTRRAMPQLLMALVTGENEKSFCVFHSR